MKTQRFKSILILVLILSMGLTACGKNSSDKTNENVNVDSNSSNEVSLGPAKDSIVFGISAEPVSLDPKLVIDVYSFLPIIQVFDTLVYENQDGDIVPGLAESWEFSNDRMEVVFKLRENVKFHNGDVLTAADVAYSLTKAMESSYTAKITGAIESAEVIDDLSVKLRLKHPYEPILSSLSCANASIVNKKAMEEDEEGFARNPIGTGAYKFVEWKNGESLSFTRFDDYYRGQPPIKDFVIKIFTDKNTAVIALENGEIDILDSPPEGDRNNLMANEKLTYYETDSSMFIYLAFNNETGIFSDQRLRNAISYAIKREDIILGAVNGIGIPIHSPIAPSAFGYPKDFKNNPYDIEKAKQLIADAGYPNGFTVKLKCTENPLYSKTAEVIQEQLRQVGINAEMEIMEKGAFLEDIYTKGDFEVAVWSIISMIPDADYTVYSRFHSQMLGGGNNFMRANIPGMDELLEKSRISSSEDERKEIYVNVSELVKEHAPLIPLFCGMNSLVANKDLKGVAAKATQKYYIYDYSW